MPKGHILVVDDEVEIREGLEALLSSEGFDVTPAETGAQGLAALEVRPFDLLLLDVSLPDRNGLELLREIRRREPSLSIILITAYGSIDMARAAFKSGAQDYITKPWSNDELIAQVSLAIEGHRLREENVQLKRAFKQRYSVCIALFCVPGYFLAVLVTQPDFIVLCQFSSYLSFLSQSSHGLYLFFYHV